MCVCVRDGAVARESCVCHREPLGSCSQISRSRTRGGIAETLVVLRTTVSWTTLRLPCQDRYFFQFELSSILLRAVSFLYTLPDCFVIVSRYLLVSFTGLRLHLEDGEMEVCSTVAVQTRQ